MGKNDGSGKSIYGGVPVPGELTSAVKNALDSLGDSSSNTINGPLKTPQVDYPEQDGKV